MKQEITAVQKEAKTISSDMRELYQEFKAGKLKREDTDTLANVAGKNLKALAIIIADQMRQDGHMQMITKMKAIENNS